ncbi:hypothetical protein QCE47_27765 [Caballeronia sp. LZ025]|uniref:hypothetical protein n=1 Tax=Caballeronia TaxID=1827195 RepID=UPI001FD0D705|nr:MULTISPECIES: hypothetical protein [Caballeronia]MDR5736113.1 hypothetical protein [Caballeronia sp. LZ025]
MVVEIRTKKDAVDFISANLAREEDDVPAVIVGGELAQISIHIEGENYHGSFPGEFARGLWEFQEAIYNAVAFSLYGVEDIRRLTAEQKDDYKIVFDLEKGSLDIGAMLETFLEKFAEGITKMDSKHKAISVVAVALILATGFGAVHLIDANAEVQKAQIEAHAKSDEEQQRTEQFKVIADAVKGNPIATQFAKASEEGARAIVKRAQGATEVRVGSVTFDKDAIDEINQRAAKEKPAAVIVTADFVVVRVETRDSSMTKLILASEKTGEFSAIMQDDDFDADQINKLWLAIRGRQKVALEVNATYVRNAVKSAQIIRVL